jgi:hypothetical protein
MMAKVGVKNSTILIAVDPLLESYEASMPDSVSRFLKINLKKLRSIFKKNALILGGSFR